MEDAQVIEMVEISSDDYRTACDICYILLSPADFEFRIHPGCTFNSCRRCVASMIKMVCMDRDRSTGRLLCFCETYVIGFDTIENYKQLFMDFEPCPKEAQRKWDKICNSIWMYELYEHCATRHCPEPDCKFMVLVEDECSDVEVTKCYYCDIYFCCLCMKKVSADSHSCKLRNKSKRRRTSWRTKGFGRRIRRCPTCMTPIHKTGGCKHMRCSSCATMFCFNCGRQDTGGDYCRCERFRYFASRCAVWLLEHLCCCWLD